MACAWATSSPCRTPTPVGGNGYVEGAVTIGVVVHGDSVRGGHGPGVTPVMSAAEARIAPRVVSERNIAELLGLRATVDA